MKQMLFKMFAGPVGMLVGHRNLIRTGKFIERAGRLDYPNSISNNGEALVQEVVLKNCTSPIIIDCGANKGQWSTEMASTARKTNVKGGRVFCVEPSRYTFKELKTNLSKIPSGGMEFTSVNIALSNACGNATLQIVHDGAGTNSLLITPTARGRTETVEMKTLDIFAVDYDIGHINLLKVDAEGHDPEVLAGATEMLSNNRITVIQFEYNWRWIYGGHFLRDIFLRLQKYGYCLGKIAPKGILFFPDYDVDLETFVEGNYIACTAEFKNNFPEIRL